MASNTEIANIAISHLGSGKDIGDLDSENSPEANAVRRFYNTARDEVLRDFPWPFATKYVALGLVASNPDDVADEWDYSYRYPSDCLYLRRIASGSRNDSRQSRVNYIVSQDDQGLLILTDMQDACMQYTVRVTDESRFSPDFVMAFSYLLAFYTAPRITAGDPFNLQDRTIKAYFQALSKARANAINEEQVDEEVESEYIRERA